MSAIDPPIMSADSPAVADPAAQPATHELPPADPRRFKALAVIAIAQLMIVLDGSIVNLAIPSAAADLQIGPADVQWIVTAYTLTFGGFLLLGGRIADYWGRKRTFMVGLGGFALASLIGGLAPSMGLLIAARACRAGSPRCSPRPRSRSSASASTTPRSAPRRSASSVRSPEPARPSACCSAACSPSTCRGAGASR